MKRLFYVFMIANFLSSVSLNNSAFAQNADWLRYSFEKGDTPANVLRRLKQTPLFGKNSSVNKFKNINPVIKNHNDIPVGQLVYLPIVSLPESDLWTVSTGVVHFISEPQRHTAHSSNDKINVKKYWQHKVHLASELYQLQIKGTNNNSGVINSKPSFGLNIQSEWINDKAIFGFNLRSLKTQLKSDDVIAINQSEFIYSDISLSFKYKVSPNANIGISLGIEERPSFITSSTNNLDVDFLNPLYLQLRSEFNLLNNSEWRVDLEPYLQLTNKKESNQHSFDYGYKLGTVLSLQNKKKNKVNTHLELFYQDDNPANYTQTSYGALLMLGLSFGSEK